MLFGLVGRKFKVDVASASECGLVRKENQDHFVADPKALVFCVADGMGGGEAGGEASEVVCRNVSAVLHDYASFADRVRLVDDAIRDVKKGKDVSVCSPYYRFMRVYSKVMPHSIVMKQWLKGIRDYI